jgi:hypothetical protein
MTTCPNCGSDLLFADQCLNCGQSTTAVKDTPKTTFVADHYVHFDPNFALVQGEQQEPVAVQAHTVAGIPTNAKKR